MPYKIPDSAFAQFRDASRRFLFTEEGTLRDDAFGEEFPEFRLAPSVKEQIENQLGQPIAHASQEAVLDAVKDLATENELFFQAFQANMPRFCVQVPFYDDFDTYFESNARRTLPDIDVTALAGNRPVAGGHIADTTHTALVRAAALNLAGQATNELTGQGDVGFGKADDGAMASGAENLALHIDHGFAPTRVDPELGINANPDFAFPEVTDASRKRIEAADEATRPIAEARFTAGLVAEGRPASMTPADIAARARARSAAADEGNALGANTHANFEFPTGTTTPEGIEAARAAAAASGGGMQRGGRGEGLDAGLRRALKRGASDTAAGDQ